MEDRRFDSMAAALGRALDRRSGIKGLAAAAAALAAAGTAVAKPTRRKEERGPGTEGPCGPKAKDNVCKSAKDCCTGICNKKSKKCRCISRGKACTEDRNCCNRGGQPVSCVDGVCKLGGGGTIPTGQPCQPGDGCQDKKAICTTYDNGAPAGTYCLLQTGGACGSTDGFCTSQFCNAGACEPCTVCSNPAKCRYRTIGAAVGDVSPDTVIGIAAGTYDTYMEVDTDNLTLRRCGAADAGSVAWTQDAGDGSSIDLEETGVSAFTVKNIDFFGAFENEVIVAKGASDKRLRLTIEGCTFTGKYSVSTDFNYSAIATDNYTNTTIIDTTFTGFHTDNDNGGAFSCDGDLSDRNIITMTNVKVTGCFSAYGGGGLDIRGATATLTNCTLTGNSSTNYAGGLNMDAGGTVTLIDCTISGNSTTATSSGDGVGGGVSVRNSGQVGADITTLVIQGTTTITGNTATGPNASNGGGVISKEGGIITGGSLTNITSNNPSGQDCTILASSVFSTVSCATWT